MSVIGPVQSNYHEGRPVDIIHVYAYNGYLVRTYTCLTHQCNCE